MNKRPKLNIEEHDESRTLVWDDEIQAFLEYVAQLESRASNFEKELREQVDSWPQNEIDEFIEKLAKGE